MENYEMSVPEDHLLTDHSHDGSIKDKWFHMHSLASERVTTMRDGVRTRGHRIESQVRSNPTKWAAIAAGAGFGLGVIGRIMRHRASRASMPHLVIIESSC